MLNIKRQLNINVTIFFFLTSCLFMIGWKIWIISLALEEKEGGRGRRRGRGDLSRGFYLNSRRLRFVFSSWIDLQFKQQFAIVELVSSFGFDLTILGFWFDLTILGFWFDLTILGFWFDFFLFMNLVDSYCLNLFAIFCWIFCW